MSVHRVPIDTDLRLLAGGHFFDRHGVYRTVKAALRVVSWTMAIVCAVILLAFGLVQIQQHLFRHRAAQLLADFQSIRLHGSTWSDAQLLMRRWGAWGSAKGPCTATDCLYIISIEDAWTRQLSSIQSENWRTALTNRVAPFYILFGGHPAEEQLSFVVQDGFIWRSGIALDLSVTRWRSPTTEAVNTGYDLLLSARASDVLQQRHSDDHWILGSNEQLSDHPEYKAGRPGGCEICMAARVTFTPHLPQAELRQITNYDLSCLTRFHPCLTLPDVLPAARAWRLYPEAEGEPTQTPRTDQPKPCNVSAATLGRDAVSVLAVQVLSKKQERTLLWANQSSLSEQAEVRVIEELEGDIALPSAHLVVIPYTDDRVAPEATAEPLTVGDRYLLLFRANRRDETGAPRLERCGVLADTPEVRSELANGMARTDGLRRKDSFTGPSW